MSSAAEFDQNFYLTNNADVVLAISQGSFANALDHFNQFGGKELRAPNSTFNPSSFLKYATLLPRFGPCIMTTRFYDNRVT